MSSHHHTHSAHGSQFAPSDDQQGGQSHDSECTDGASDKSAKREHHLPQEAEQLSQAWAAHPSTMDICLSLLLTRHCFQLCDRTSSIRPELRGHEIRNQDILAASGAVPIKDSYASVNDDLALVSEGPAIVVARWGQS